VDTQDGRPADRDRDDRDRDDRDRDDRDRDDRDRDERDRDERDPDDQDRDQRDRDQQGRPRNARPRDALGRPLRYGAEGVARLPEDPLRSAEQSLAQAQLLLDAGRPFEAHEVLEDAWKSAPDAERGLWRGLAQLAVGLTHAARGNQAGALTLIARGAATLAEYAEYAEPAERAEDPGQPPHRVEVRALLAWSASVAAAGSLPLPPPPRLTATS
jgi:hypothetical protein